MMGMEPRWPKEFSPDWEFVGGTEKVDIWACRSDSYSVRLVWGERTERWHFATRQGLKFGELTGGLTPGLSDAPTSEELKEAGNYIELFAPWVFDRRPNTLEA